jgi:hypothetical protein
MTVQPATCVLCENLVTDIERGWLKNQNDSTDPRIWFLCETCLKRKPYIEWTKHGTPSLRFYSLCACCSRKEVA